VLLKNTCAPAKNNILVQALSAVSSFYGVNASIGLRCVGDFLVKKENK
jgi:hypothetical protein